VAQAAKDCLTIISRVPAIDSFSEEVQTLIATIAVFRVLSHCPCLIATRVPPDCHLIAT